MLKTGITTIVLAGAVLGAITVTPKFTAVSYDTQSGPERAVSTNEATVSSEEVAREEKDTREVVTHVPIPEQVKTIYMSSCVAGTPSFRDKLVALTEETEINSIIIDIKDYSGSISFKPEGEAWQYAWEAASCGARDMKEFIATLHDKGIYVIGRVTVFQDPLYTGIRPNLAVKRADGVTNWKDYKGLSFIDVAATEYWDHIVELTKESYNIGFDELNYDYVRYPSDGPMSDISFTHSAKSAHGNDKQANLEAFFKYLNEKVKNPDLYNQYKHENTGLEEAVPHISADLFGMTTTNYDDLSIGQLQERALPYFDAIAPMVYPSHYPKSFLGLGNPNDHPYKVVYHAMKTGVDRALSTTTFMSGFTHEPLYATNASGTKVATEEFTKQPYGGERFRTWIQDFDYGGDYDAADVRAQIQASYDAGVDSWMIWAPSNIYTKAALESAEL